MQKCVTGETNIIQRLLVLLFLVALMHQSCLAQSAESVEDSNRLSTGAQHLLQVFSAKHQARGMTPSAIADDKFVDSRNLEHFALQVSRLLTYIDFDIAELNEVKRKLDDKHDKAMKYNAIANLMIGTSSGILPASLQYPGSTLTTIAPNTISIAGSSAAALTSVIALKKAGNKGRVQESQLLSDFLRADGRSSIYPNLIQEFFETCTMADLDYVGRKINDVRGAKGIAKYGMDANVRSWLIAYWKENFSSAFQSAKKNSERGSDSTQSTNSPSFPFVMLTSDQIADRITMLTHLRILLECSQVFKQEAVIYADNANNSHDQPHIGLDEERKFLSTSSTVLPPK